MVYVYIFARLLSLGGVKKTNWTRETHLTKIVIIAFEIVFAFKPC